jgi:hypothetical protein
MVVDGPNEIGQGVDCLIDLGALTERSNQWLTGYANESAAFQF